MVNRWKRTLERIEIDPTTECWEWTGKVNSAGYGPHRRVYEALVGPVPDGLHLDHVCRNRRCLNPAHLEPVTRSENLRRGSHWNKVKTQCKNGHLFIPENTRVTAGTGGWDRRVCTACERERGQRRRVPREGVVAWRTSR